MLDLTVVPVVTDYCELVVESILSCNDEVIVRDRISEDIAGDLDIGDDLEIEVNAVIYRHFDHDRVAIILESGQNIGIDLVFRLNDHLGCTTEFLTLYL